jgi:hypothetical protein
MLFGGCASEAAPAARTVHQVDGEIRALAFSGDALVVAREPPRRGLVVERLVAGSAAQAIRATSFKGDQVLLAASPQAIALSLTPGILDARRPSSVMVGAPLGPLREVARCSTPGTAAPVAVAGSRVAWRAGGCGVARLHPFRGTPAAIVVGDADPRAPSRSIALPEAPARVARPRVGRRWRRRHAGAAIRDRQRARGVLRGGRGRGDHRGATGGLGPSGSSATARASSCAGRSRTSASATPRKQVFTVAPGATRRRQVPLGGCVNAVLSPAPSTGSGPVAAGERILAYVGVPGGLVDKVSLVSVRSDGRDRRELARGTYRRPFGVATDGDRVAWWEPHCKSGGEIVIQERPEARRTLAPCRAEILTRSARLRAGAITVRMRCPAGCTGSIFGRPLPYDFSPGPVRKFTFSAGTHALSVPIALGRRRSGQSIRVGIGVNVEHGPGEQATVRLRR